MVICDSSPPPHFTLLASSAIQLHCTQRFPLHLVNHRVLFSYTDCYGYNSDYRSGNVVARIKKQRFDSKPTMKKLNGQEEKVVGRKCL